MNKRYKKDKKGEKEKVMNNKNMTEIKDLQIVKLHVNKAITYLTKHHCLWKFIDFVNYYDKIHDYLEDVPGLYLDEKLVEEDVIEDGEDLIDLIQDNIGFDTPWYAVRNKRDGIAKINNPIMLYIQYSDDESDIERFTCDDLISRLKGNVIPAIDNTISKIKV